MKKIVEHAIDAKSRGIKYLCSIVKRVHFTTYYHLVSVDRIIENNGWIPAPIIQFATGSTGRYGITGKKVDWNITEKRYK